MGDKEDEFAQVLRGGVGLVTLLGPLGGVTENFDTLGEKLKKRSMNTSNSVNIGYRGAVPC